MRSLSFSLAWSVLFTIAAHTLALRAEEAVDAKKPSAEGGGLKAANTPSKGDASMADRSVPVRELKMKEPFAVPSVFVGFPSKPASEVRVFQGMAALQAFLVEKQIVAYPIGEFASDAGPKDPVEFCEILTRHAGEIGADYVVVCKDAEEIGANFVNGEKQNFGALAYKRVGARLGIKYDGEAIKNGVTKIIGFATGSEAQASGLKEGDVVVKVDGSGLSGKEYRAKTLRWKAGDKVTVEFVRDGKPMKLEVKLTAS